MNMVRMIWVMCFVLTIFSRVLGQDKDKNLIETYDKFHDVTIIQTKPDDVDALIGKEQTAVGFIAFIVKGKDVNPANVYLYFTPQTFSFGGTAKKNAYEMKGNRVYFPPKSDVILFLDGERIKLEFNEKEFGISNSGQWKEGFSTIVNLAMFQKMVASKWELSINGININFARDGKSLSTRVRSRLQILLAKVSVS